MLRSFPLLIAMLAIYGISFSQIDRCSTDEMVKKELLLNPDKRLILEQLELFTEQFVNDYNSGRILESNYVIPVVVHVIHDYGDERINFSQIESAIESMNNDFNLRNDDLIDLNGNFISSVANNNDTVFIFSPENTSQYPVLWNFENNSSVKKFESICSIGPVEIIADDPGNNYFSGGILKILYDKSLPPVGGELIAKIITTEARGFEDIVADVGVEFRLATKDPDGNCTNGVTYNQSVLTFNGGENVKDDTYWDNDMYLNIWTVANVASGAAAYAYYPGSAPQNHEGILCQHDYFGTTGTSSNSNWRRHTISHEVGHYLNLPHPWGSTNDPSLEENCGTDDGVDDTPNTIGASGCYSYDSQISCESLDNVANIMDYTNCAYMFSNGQKARMIAALNSTSGARNNLWSSENLTLTGTDDSHYFSDPFSDCYPIADFQVVGEAIGALGISEGFNVTFQDMTYNVPENQISYQWYFPGASPSSSTTKNPTVTYNESGQHDVTLVVSNNNGSSQLVKEKCIVILDRTNAPFIEDFESSSFPISESFESPSWYVFENYPSEENWKSSSLASFDGTQSIRIRSKDFSAGFNIKQEMYSPDINCSDYELGEPLNLYFNLAYSKRIPYLNIYGNSVMDDELIIYRKHAGQEFMERARYNVSDLINNDQIYFNDYVPSQNDWIEKVVNLGSSAGQESLILKFEFTGKGYLSTDTLIPTNLGGDYISNNIGGNWLYIDNVRVGNPIDIEDRIVSNENEKNTKSNIIFDLYGRKYALNEKLNPGVYFKDGVMIFIND